jgi:hypothetical protein
MNDNSILAYGTLCFVYTFLGPFLYEQLFYHNQTTNLENKTQPKEVRIKRFIFVYLEKNLNTKIFFW